MSGLDLEKVDWSEFYDDHPVSKSLRTNLKIHARQESLPKNWHIPRWIGSGDIVAIFGPPEGGKSALGVDIACRLAAGWDLNGNQLEYRRNVLYIAAERARQVQRRIDAFCRHHEGEPFDNLVLYDGPIELTQPMSLRAITRSANHVFEDNDGDVDVMVIDTLAAAMSASDSDPNAMAKAVGNIIDVSRNGNREGFPITVIVVHHSPVSGEARMRGAGQLQGAIDMSIYVTRKKGVSIAKVQKNNENDDRPSLRYTMQSVALSDFGGIVSTAPVVVYESGPGAASRDEADDSKPTEPKKPSRAQRDALDTLRAAIAANDDQPVTEAQWKAVVYAAAGDITPAGKRLKFSRDRKIVEAGLATESGGKFSAAA
jgi:hypothetical protein